MAQQPATKMQEKTESVIVAKLKAHFAMIRKDIHRNKAIYMIALPMILYYFIFKYIPMYGIQIAFKDYNLIKGISASPWVGFKHFIKFVDSYYFIRVVKNTFLISLYGTLFAFPAPILFALLLNEVRSSKFRRTVQTITYMPHFVSTVVVCGMIHMFCASDGFLGTAMAAVLGGEPKNLLMNPDYFRTIYILSDIWKNIGWNSILYIAAIMGIDQAQYEAAVIDGAGKFAQALYVTIPGIMPTIIIKLIFRMGEMMDVGFEKVFLLYNEATWSVSDVISTYTYREGLLNMNYSYSAAVSLFNTVINFVLLWCTNFISRKVSETSLF